MTPKFTVEQFQPTQFNTAEDKAKFANAFVKFVEQDFPRARWSKPFYRRLCSMFGFIAHYDEQGFWDTFFTNAPNKLRFLRDVANCGCYGSPLYTWCDVEAALKDWLRGSGIVEKTLAQLNAEVETTERSELARLRSKYEVES